MIKIVISPSTPDAPETHKDSILSDRDIDPPLLGHKKPS